MNTKKVFLTTIALMGLCASTAFAQETGIEIKGITWATRNVAAPGTFAANPENPGMFYQWNRKKAWSATGEYVTGWDSSKPTGETWAPENDPCPAGWRVPTNEELESLMSTIKYWVSSSPQGCYFGSGDNIENMLFLPAAGMRYYNNGELVWRGTYGYYWSTEAYDSSDAYYMSLSSSKPEIHPVDRKYGHCVRCVKDDSRTSVQSTPADQATVLGYYSTMGQRLAQEPTSGIYIIIYDNGKAEKVVK